jgi:hypothetical protein
MKKSAKVEPEELETRNAKITDTFLGIEDHGILTFNLYLEGNGWGQSFGGYSCSGKFLSEAVEEILKVVGVDSWEKLPGMNVRIQGTHSRVARIGHILKDEWYDITAHSKTFVAKGPA